MKKMTTFMAAMLATSFLCFAQEDVLPEAAMAQLAQEQGVERATIKNIASVSWRDGKYLNIRVFECTGKEINSRVYTGERKDGEWEGKWVKDGGYKTTGTYVAACSWIEESGKNDTVHIRLFVGDKDADEVTEHIYEGRSDVKPGEKDAGTWSVGTKKFKGETASVDVSIKKSGKAVVNLFTATEKGKVHFYQQFEGSAWKKIDL